MITIFFSMSQGKNHISYSSIAAILENLEIFHSKTIKRRWCFQCLKDLTDAGFISRRTRYRNDPSGQIAQIPSMISFKLKGIVWLVKMGVKGAKELYKSMVTWLQKNDKRHPKQEDFDDGSWKPADPEEKRNLEGLLGIVTKKIK